MGLLFGGLIPAPKAPINLRDLYTNSPAPTGNEAYWRSKSQGSISNAHPGVSHRVADAISGGLKTAGLRNRRANDLSSRIAGALDTLTPLGAATSAEDAKAAFHQGRYPAAVGNALLAAMSAMPDGGALGAKVSHSIIAPLFHGSPHKFEKFALDKVGTGEGAQAYGHGLYFAENPAVAKGYQQTLAGTSVRLPDGRVLNHSAMPFATPQDQARRGAIQLLADHGTVRAAKRATTSPNIRAELERLAGAVPTNGHLYEVKLDANPEDFLDWDRRLAEQPAPIRDVFAQFGITPAARGEEAYDQALKKITGSEDYWKIGPAGPAAQTSEVLRQRGILGARYLDQGSRGVGGGTSNYVVFDPSKIDIVNRR